VNVDQVRPLRKKPQSNYEGFKRLDQMLEGVDSGRLKGPREPVKDIYCPLCHERKTSQVYIRSMVLGTRRKDLPFRHIRGGGDHWTNIPKGLIVCKECAEQFNREHGTGL
jgi:hypothetical protein